MSRSLSILWKLVLRIDGGLGPILAIQSSLRNQYLADLFPPQAKQQTLSCNAYTKFLFLLKVSEGYFRADILAWPLTAMNISAFPRCSRPTEPCGICGLKCVERDSGLNAN